MNYSKKMLLTALVCGSTMYTGTAWAAEAAAEAPAEKTAEVEVAEFVLEPMLVTATRTEKNIFQVPANATVITKEELQERNITSVTDAIKTKSGIFISPRTDTYGKIQMRGFGPENILVLQDGMPLNNSWSGQPDLNSIPVENIERIEVVRGAGSALYGGHAVGGVVNIITKEASKQLSGGVTVNYGSHSTWKKAVNIGTKVNDRWTFDVAYEKSQTDGVSGYRITKTNEKTGTGTTPTGNIPQLGNGRYVVGERGERHSETENVSFAVKYNFDKDRSLRYAYRHSEHEYSYHNPVSYIRDAFGNMIWKNDSLKTPNGKKLKIDYSDFLGNQGLRKSNLHTLNYTDKKNLWVVNAGYQDIYRDGYSDAASPTSIDYAGAGTASVYPSKNYNFDVQKTWEIKKHTLTAGANYKQEEMKRKSLTVSNWRDPESTSGLGSAPLVVGGKARNLSFFVQDEYNFDKYFTMYLGARVDNYKKYDGYTDNTSIASASYTEVSPKAVIEWHPNDTTSYYMSYGHSFNPPQLYQMYRMRTVGSGTKYLANPDLKPEKTDTFELGFKKKLKKTTIGVSAFYSRIKDLIDTEDVAASTKKYVNRDSGKRKGIELEATHEFDKHWSTYLNYTWQQSETPSTANSSMIQNNNETPKHLLHTGVEYKQGKFTGVLDGMFVSAREAYNKTSGEYGSEDPYFVMNLYLNYKFTKEWSVQFGIDNVLDRKFYAGEAIQGRTYNLGLRFEF